LHLLLRDSKPLSFRDHSQRAQEDSTKNATHVSERASPVKANLLSDVWHEKGCPNCVFASDVATGAAPSLMFNAPYQLSQVLDVFMLVCCFCSPISSHHVMAAANCLGLGFH